jgi:[ribosomal protein S18]-alanine N-acetyltransferase
MPVVIRSAVLDDMPAIVALERKAVSAAHWSVVQYGDRIDAGRTLLAESDGQACGFLCARVVVGEWEIENVVVEEGFRRRGIAGELVRAVIAEARSAGGSSVLLEVRESNLAARRLYEKCGFRETGRRREYYREPTEDAILYRLAL